MESTVDRLSDTVATMKTTLKLAGPQRD
ncbi:hypothetical protein Pint_14123 [Pistacia integerrima]|uniref:Uncharacterized protein n=1 Tax=Pistacia integerrima TaxID=434235 RepID=A0ACC0YBB3_9ROSI|nr:hypothetical protein Pint_14123 [Pistacia integerrima]